MPSDGLIQVRRVGHCLVAAVAENTAAVRSMAQLHGEFADLCAEISCSDDIRTLVLAYADSALRPAPGEVAADAQTCARAMISLAADLDIPVIAALEGDALGLGLELALACDIRIGVQGARFGLPQLVEGGMPCAGGTQRLPRLVGRSKALEMILTGQAVAAEEAHRIGLIQHLVAAGDSMASAVKLASDMSKASPLATRFVKEALYSGADLTLDQGMRMDLDLYLLLFSTSDRVEGIRAFQQKRSANFAGR